jgi:hypothetical protein
VTRKKNTSLGDPKERGWICEYGHPKYRVTRGAPTGYRDTRRTCHICEKIAQSDPRMCIRGHRFPSVERQCRLCLIYRQNPWLKELDETGIAQCPRGHWMEHQKLNYNTPKRRACGVCHVEQRARAIAAASEANRGKPNVNKGRTMGVKQRYVDWVVVHRLMVGRLDEVYAMRRGTTKGPTAMEEWVAYNSFNPLESGHRLAYSSQAELKRTTKGDKGKSHDLLLSFIKRWEGWGVKGRKHGFPAKTLDDLLAEI